MEVTNQELLEKMKEGFNKNLSMSGGISKQNEWLIDHLNPTYQNVRAIHEAVFTLLEEVKGLKTRIAQMEDELRRLR